MSGTDFESRLSFYHNIFLICGIIALLFLALAVVLFFVLKIRTVFSELTGRTAKKAISAIEASGASGALSTGDLGHSARKRLWGRGGSSGVLARRRGSPSGELETGKMGPRIEPPADTATMTPQGISAPAMSMPQEMQQGYQAQAPQTYQDYAQAPQQAYEQAPQQTCEPAAPQMYEPAAQPAYEPAQPSYEQARQTYEPAQPVQAAPQAAPAPQPSMAEPAMSGEAETSVLQSAGTDETQVLSGELTGTAAPAAEAAAPLPAGMQVELPARPVMAAMSAQPAAAVQAMPPATEQAGEADETMLLNASMLEDDEPTAIQNPASVNTNTYPGFVVLRSIIEIHTEEVIDDGGDEDDA